jgi:putative glutamine amidotransferase/von Willebrand factor type A domain-containing protein
MIMSQGGVSKTDISRTAAERAVGALEGDDQVGVLAFNGTTEWIVPLQTVSAIGDLHGALAQLQPAGETRISPAMEAAADGLRGSDRELRHIILFSDGFTPELVDDSFFGGQRPPGTDESDLVAQAAALKEEGITVSVVATGEGAAPHLEELAIAGGGRFYPGRDLAEIPEIFVEEARIASRSFINEGAFPPRVTSTAAPVRGLTEAPPVAGYLATTPKETADVLLQVGEFADPLLSSWRVGLGKVTAWTSDSGGKWAADWAAWSGWADFWSATVRDTFALEGASGHELRANVAGDSVVMELVSDAPWPAGTKPIAHVSTPGGETVEVELTRTSDTEFAGSLAGDELGSYSIGVTAAAEDPATPAGRVASAVVSRSYSAEYRPPATAAPDLAALAARTGGRGEITATQVLDPEGLRAGSSTWHPRRLLLLIALLLWPISIALRRLQFGAAVEELRLRRRRLRPA